MRLAVALLALSTPSAAQQDIDCANTRTQAEMNICAARDYADADADLNAVWAELAPRRASAAWGAPLLEAQRAWIIFRDAACEAERMQFEGGTIAPLIHADCLTRLTERRTKDLRLFLDQ